MSIFFSHANPSLQNDGIVPLNVVLIKGRKKAKISYRYNQVPHLTQDTILWESDKAQEKNHTQESQESSLLMFSISLWDRTY